jgi:hypothetical protein
MSEFLIGAKPSNIQIQKTGAMTPCHPGGPMPASDLERRMDEPEIPSLTYDSNHSANGK